MRQAQDRLVFRTRPRDFVDLTTELVAWVSRQGIGTGLLTIFCRHTSASLLIQENADPDVLRDLQTAFGRLAPENAGYRHDIEGPDDMPAHIRTALTQSSLSIPVSGGRPVLGTWQAIYLWEHRATAHQRELVLHLVGE